MICFLLFAAALAEGRARAAQDPSRPQQPATRKVLMLFSVAKELPGVMMMEQSVRAELEKQSTNRIEFFAEHLDASRFSGIGQYRLFLDYVREKYAGQNLDLVMSFSARDFGMAGDLPRTIFREKPFLFVTVNELDVPGEIERAKIPGIVQRFDVRGTLDLIFRLQPETHRVIVIGGATDADRLTLGRVNEAIRSLSGGIEFEFWTNRPMTQLIAAAGSLPEDSVIFLSEVQRDISGQPFYTSQVARLIAGSARVPIYVLGGGAIGTGALGGAVVDPSKLGAEAADLAMRILAGTSPSDLPIDVQATGTLMVDWRALQRWKINPSRLPADCVVRFRPESLWDEHKGLIIAAVLVILAQAATIAGLLAQRAHRRRAEAELQAQRAELAHVTRVSTMGQLASALAHELNQPLAAILRNAEAAELFLKRENPDLEEIRAILADIRKDDQRAGDVIERMRSFLKRRRLQSSTLNLSELLEETVALARPDAATKQVRLTLDLPAHLPQIKGDRIHLQQVLLNLLLNGMDALSASADEDKWVAVRAAQNADGTVEVAVADNGSGIPADKASRIFEPFFTTKTHGLGMGLAISRTIIEAHSGKIRAENNPTKGATFRFTLPIAEVSQTHKSGEVGRKEIAA